MASRTVPKAGQALLNKQSSGLLVVSEHSQKIMVEIEEVPREKVNFSEELLRSTSFARQLADQMTLAKAYVILAKEHGNLQLAWELSSQIVFSIFLSFSLAAMYGVDVAALGMLSTIATGLAIDAYGPISDNAGGIAEMAGMSHRIHERTNALDAVGNTTAAIGKGFAIGSAALVSLALFGAFVSRAAISTVDVLTPKVFIGLIVGAMLPYWFSAMTMKSVGSVAFKMVEEVRR
uniref:H(+)-exporting diphosphatase n=1 Tax=Zea mays TaxID=4577 RepID=A0A804RC58_MAIZE